MQRQAEAPVSATIEGKLVLVDQHPAVQAKDKTYILRWPGFYFHAYVDGIKEGSSIKAEGYLLPTFPGQDKPFFDVAKAVIGSKTYEDDDFGPGMGMMGGPGMGMGGRWDDDARGPAMGRGMARVAPKSATIEGKLAIVGQSPAIQAKDKSYILRWPEFFYHLYADGLKEGAQAKIEGYELSALPGQDKPYFVVTKATVGSKTYEVEQAGGYGYGPGYDDDGRGRGGMGGRGGRW